MRPKLNVLEFLQCFLNKTHYENNKIKPGNEFHHLIVAAQKYKGCNFLTNYPLRQVDILECKN